MASSAVRLSNGILGSLAILALAGASLKAQLPPQPSRPLHGAYYAWSEGRYTDALTEYLTILEAAGDPGLVEEIAALTGELYEVHEVTTDGLDIGMAPDGRHLSYVVSGDSDLETHVARITPGAGPPTEVAVIPGSAVVLGPGGRVAYRTLGDEALLSGPRAAMEAARLRQSTLEFRAAEAQLRWVEASTAELRMLDLATGRERTIDTSGKLLVDWAFAEDGSLLIAAGLEEASGSTGLFRAGPSDTGLTPVPAPPGYRTDLRPAPGARYVVYTVPATDPAPSAPGSLRPEAESVPRIGVLDLRSGEERVYDGESPALSADGSTLAWVERPADFVPDRMRFPHGPGGRIHVLDLTREGPPRVLIETDRPLGEPALSPDGAAVTYARMPGFDWEVFVHPTASGGTERRVTTEVQHDQFPVFLSRGTVLAAKGEGRHRRSYLYDLASGKSLELFHNNTVRTIAPEYEWAVSPTADWVAIVAERDGDTVSEERGVYVVDLTRRVTREALTERLRTNIETERSLRAVAAGTFGPIADSVRAVTQAVSSARVFEYARSLHSFGSKHITQPGNQAAGVYIAERLREFGYEPEIQTFQARGIQTSNVIATLPGHTDPGVLYVISSHYDSHQRGPGADDNSSGTTALLEVARVLRDHPQRATIQFAFFTGEEAGLLGSRHYVAELGASGAYLAGALNNDMVGWANDHRLDNTIRYSNDGIRDIQHAAAMTFSKLITYDARYYKSTDAHAFYEAYGDIVGGIGSHPVLGNPHYHQATDALSTINHDLVVEVARTTAATIMALARHPSRHRGLLWQRAADGSTRVAWALVPERDAVRYRVRFRATAEAPWTEEVTTAARIDLPALPDGAEVQVRAVSRDGVEGWDWGRIVVGELPGGAGSP